MCKEVGINQNSQTDRKIYVGVAGIPDIEDTSDTRQIAAYRCVHETGEKRHVAEPEEIVFGIRPRTNIRLEKLHHSPDDMENQYDLGFPNGLHAENEQERLHCKCGQKQKVIARQPCMIWPKPFCE